ncbi:MAG: hypothetical protein WCR27_07445 [Eubacteriales bacterium]
MGMAGAQACGVSCGVSCGGGSNCLCGIAIVAIIILLLIAMGIVF